MSDNDIETLPFRILREYATSLTTTPPNFFNNKRFVLFATRSNWTAYEKAPFFHLDPEVAKTAAVSSCLLTGSINEKEKSSNRISTAKFPNIK